ncbi:MAG: DUF1178 family protein [Proteobacteria bacterium]|nr:DUF1178 family protein [Pseudomonadota bacterium]
MIVYDLACDQEHKFEGWFSSQEDFDKQVSNGQLSCPVCGSITISKQLSAPYLNILPDENASSRTKQKEMALAGVSLQQLHDQFIEYIAKNIEDVGTQFPDEARKIFYGESDNRSIRGEATVKVMQELKDEGIEVYALPPRPIPPGKLN